MSAVLRGYRRALRATQTIFGGDANILTARAFVREQFEANRNEKDSKMIDEQVRAIDEALEFALGNVVKGSVNSRGNLEVDVNYDGDDVPELGAPSLEPPKSCSGNGGGGRTVTQHSPKENPKTSR